MVVKRLEMEGLLHSLKAVVTSHVIGRRKPSPEPFKAILELMSCSPEETLMVGDTDDDGCGAWGVGLKSAVLEGGRCSDYFIRSLDDLLEVIV